MFPPHAYMLTVVCGALYRIQDKKLQNSVSAGVNPGEACEDLLYPSLIP